MEYKSPKAHWTIYQSSTNPKRGIKTGIPHPLDALLEEA